MKKCVFKKTWCAQTKECLGLFHLALDQLVGSICCLCLPGHGKWILFCRCTANFAWEYVGTVDNDVQWGLFALRGHVYDDWGIVWFQDVQCEDFVGYSVIAAKDHVFLVVAFGGSEGACTGPEAVVQPADVFSDDSRL